MRTKLVIMGVAVLTLSMLSGCSRQDPGQIPPSAEHPLLYPGAQDIQTRSVKDASGYPLQVTSFRLNTDSTAVISFYDENLSKEGWGIGDATSPNKRHYYWIGSCPVYGLDVSVESTNEQPQVVEVVLTLRSEGCR